MKMRLIIVVTFSLILSACAAGEKLLEQGIRLQIVNPYAEIKRDFERGRIMRARRLVLGMEKGDPDYELAHTYLKKKIEPARRRIFVHYLRSAKVMEQRKQWSSAMEAYAKAKSVTIKPEVMEKKRVEMEFRMRKLRFERLLVQKRKEDAAWLNDLRSYEPSRGISPKDEVYQRQRELFNDALDERADYAYSEAKRYLRRDLPEIAYVEIESHLRLQPGSGKGERVLTEVKEKLPSQLKIKLRVPKSRNKAHSAPKRNSSLEAVTSDQIHEVMKKGDLLEARRLVQNYRRSDGKDAERLQRQIEKKAESRAAELFAKGSIAFRKEKLDKAISNWGEAVALMPDQAEYVEALHRARQLKERLNLLRAQKESDPIPDEE